jgi:hypothetical protein
MDCLINAIERGFSAASPRNREEEKSRFVLRDQGKKGWAGGSLSPVQISLRSDMACALLRSANKPTTRFISRCGANRPG